MDTNRSKFTEQDLRKVRKQRNPQLSPKQARKENREERKKIARRTRRLEKAEFERLVAEGKLDETQDFDKR